MKIMTKPRHLQISPEFPKPAPPQAKMPNPEVYEQEYVFWPWGELLRAAAEWVESHAPPSAFVMDYMCGTGFLLNEIVKRRPDIHACGCDINAEYIAYGRRKYSDLKLIEGNALDYKPPKRPDLLICTAGVHHLTRKTQPRFVEKIRTELSSGCYLLLGEELIRHYETEKQRQLAILEMCDALRGFILCRNAPVEVVQAAADMMVSDLYERGEYKTSHAGIVKLVETHFEVESISRIWPMHEAEFGDWLLVCRRK